MSLDLELTNRRALVTGGTKGVGAAVVEILRGAGACCVETLSGLFSIAAYRDCPMRTRRAASAWVQPLSLRSDFK